MRIKCLRILPEIWARTLRDPGRSTRNEKRASLNLAYTHYRRGLARKGMKDTDGALADFNLVQDLHRQFAGVASLALHSSIRSMSRWRSNNQPPAAAPSVPSAPVLPTDRKPLSKKEISADHPTWCPGCGDFSVRHYAVR